MVTFENSREMVVECVTSSKIGCSLIWHDVFYHSSAGDAEQHATRTLLLCPMNFLPGDCTFANAV